MTDTTIPANAPAAPPKEKISFADYLTRSASVEGKRTEWVAGEVEVYDVSNNVLHQEFIGLLYILFRFFLKRKNLGRVLIEGIPMFVGDDKPAREPDLLIILNEHLDQLHETYLDGAADAVVEVVSPESGTRDYGAKFFEVEAEGVKEYFRFDPIRQTADLYILGEDGHYHPAGLDENGRLISHLLPGFKLNPKIFWRDPLPDEDDMLALVQAMLEEGA